MEAEADQHPEGSRISLGQLIALAAATLALLGVILSLLGFGVALAASSMFGIPYEVMLQSPFDALVLCVPVITLGAINWFAFDSEIYATLIPELLPILGVIVLVTFAGMILPWLLARQNRPASLKGGWIATLAGKPNPRKDSFGLVFARAVSSIILWAFALPIGTFLMLLALGVACLLVAFVPAVGMDAGRTYLHTYVIAAEACIPVRNSAAHMKRAAMRKKGEKRQSRPGATCVRVVSGDGATFTGRVALSTSSAILLYDPASGIARHIPTDGVIIESVDVVPTPVDVRPKS